MSMLLTCLRVSQDIPRSFCKVSHPRKSIPNWKRRDGTGKYTGESWAEADFFVPSISFARNMLISMYTYNYTYIYVYHYNIIFTYIHYTSIHYTLHIGYRGISIARLDSRRVNFFGQWLTLKRYSSPLLDYNNHSKNEQIHNAKYSICL